MKPIPRPGIDFDDKDIQRNPFPIYTTLRESYPVCQLESDGRFALSRYEDVAFCLTRSDLFGVGSTAIVSPPWLPEKHRRGMFILTENPPLHTQHRALVNKAFVHRVIGQLEPVMRATAAELIQRHNGEPIEFLQHFGYPYAAGIIGRILGTAESQNLAQIYHWIDLLEHNTLSQPSDDHICQLTAAYAELDAWYEQLVAAHNTSPCGDLLSALLSAQVDGEPLSKKDIYGALDLFLIAGFQSTAQLLATALVYLAQWDDMRQLLTDQPAEIPAFIEELLRFNGPAHSLLRYTNVPVELHGYSLPAGALVSVFAAAANRDPRHFSDPEQFILRRTNARQQIGFGVGPHTCIGAALARMEVRVALEEILRSVSQIHCPSYSELPWVSTPSTRGLKALPLMFQ